MHRAPPVAAEDIDSDAWREYAMYVGRGVELRTMAAAIDLRARTGAASDFVARDRRLAGRGKPKPVEGG